MKVFRQPLTYAAFAGMNNVSKSIVFKTLGEVKEAISPHIVLNMDTVSDLSLVKRKGKTKVINLFNAHSVFSDGSSLFVCAEGLTSPESLWMVNPFDGTYSEVCSIVGRSFPLYYLKLDKLLFMSSKVWNSIYDYTFKSVRPWGDSYSENISIINETYDSDILLAVNKMPMPCMTHLLWFASRIWGILNNKVVYTDPLAYFWYKPENAFEFPQILTMLAEIENGLYVASEDKTWFLQGRDVHEMVLTEVGAGAVSGTMSYCYFTGNSKIPPKTPFWVNRMGICAGIDGQEVNTTIDKLTFPVSGVGASVFKFNNNNPQYIVNFPHSGMETASVGDSMTVEVFRNGKLL